MPTFKAKKLRIGVATIANTAKKSDVIDCLGASLVGLIFPAVFTGTTLSLEGSVNGTDFYPLRDSSGNLITLTFTVSTLMMLASADYQMCRWMKLSATTTQGQESLVTYILKRV